MDANETVAIPPFPPRIGRYQIVAELGRGAMGIVYQGFDPNIGRTVAIKTVQLSAGPAGQELLKRFRREAQAAGLLSHPHIVTIYDAGEDQGVFYIAMEYVQGDTLEKIIHQQGTLPVEQVTTIVEDVGSALDHAHHREIIHRDIKPANIMIADGRAKVMDFGVAKMVSSTATATGTVIGTPSYMSPEGVKGLPIDGRADIFSLGVVLYEMLTNKRPFPGDNIPSVIYKIIGSQPDPPSVVNPSLHPGLNVVLSKALSKEPETRYQSCAELVRDLRNFRLLKAPVADAATTAIPASPTVARTLAPPMVSGTVAMDNQTVAIPAPPAPAAAGRVVGTPPASASAAVAPFAGASLASAASVPFAVAPAASSMWPKVAAAVVLVAVLAGGGLVWKKRQEQAQRYADAKRSAAAAAAQNQSKLDQAKPSPNGPQSDAASDAAAAAPAAAAVVAVERDVLVKSNVAGAAIKVDGKTKTEWVTPKRIRMTFGAHRIEVAKDGYKSVTQSHSVSEQGPKEIEFALAALTREIEIVTTPPGAQVNVDGTDQDALTPGRYAMPLGEHTIQVRKAGFRAESKTVKVDESTEGVTMSLQKEAASANGDGNGGKGGRRNAGAGRGEARTEGLLRIRTVPFGAAIQVDGAATDYKSPVNFPLSAGPHKITVTHRGLQPVTRDVEVKAGQLVDVEIDMIGAGVIKRR